MTEMSAVVLDINGRDILTSQDQWLRDTILVWLSDQQLVAALIQDGNDPDGVVKVYRRFQETLGTGEMISREVLRREALICLNSKSARRHIHRLTCDSNLQDWEERMEKWSTRVRLWLETPEGTFAGDAPEKPDPIAPAKQVTKDLNALQKELQEWITEEKAQEARVVL